MKVDGNLDELSDRARRLADPVGGEAEEEAAFCGGVDGSVLFGLLRHFTERLVVAELAVDVELLGDELVEHLLVAAAVGFGDLRAEFALAAFEAAMFERVKRAFHLIRERRVSVLRRVIERVR
jgi:hypothetical protein